MNNQQNNDWQGQGQQQQQWDQELICIDLPNKQQRMCPLNQSVEEASHCCGQNFRFFGPNNREVRKLGTFAEQGLRAGDHVRAQIQ